ncbi:MAG: sigma-54-dependent Fis family transcriptional regulator [Bacteroidetes bacterium]|nr:sigma-54-dependent Fis family transcriptional regulator [Bacteroidota bacterium]
MNIFVIGAEQSVQEQIAAALPAKGRHELHVIKDGIKLFERTDRPPDIVIIDLDNPEALLSEVTQIGARLPDVPIIAFITESEDEMTQSAASVGALVCVARPPKNCQVVTAINAAVRVRTLHLQLRHVQESIAQQTQLSQIIARSGSMHTVIHLIEKACKNEINVLLEGEEGTGKEHLARAIHFNGTRAAGPFLMLNCEAIPEHLLEHELFGYEGGVFEGLEVSKPGIFELAEGGTLFIDEIGSIPMTVQARLYRAMQTRLARRVGSEEDIPINVRIISSTSHNLRTLCTAGLFREDLYFRLTSFPIKIPPLRERMVDLPPLAEFFLRKHAESEGRPGLGISKETFHVFRKYDWPGNVRELEHCIQRAVVVAESMEIQPGDLPHSILLAMGLAAQTTDTGGLWQGNASPVPTMEQLKARGIRLALEATGGNIREASRLLDIGRTTMYKLIEKYHIKV